MSTVPNALVAFERAHRTASDSLEQGHKDLATIRARFLREAVPAFKGLTPRLRARYALSFQTGVLAQAISRDDVQAALHRQDISRIVPAQAGTLRAYIRHTRKRVLPGMREYAEGTFKRRSAA